jgi:hypothetical protein
MLRFLAAFAAAILAAVPAMPGSAEVALFRFNREAQLSCPGEQVVWLNTATNTFYRRGQNGYASTMTGPGAFVCRDDAERNKIKPGIDFGRQDLGQQNYRMIEPPAPAEDEAQ